MWKTAGLIAIGIASLAGAISAPAQLLINGAGATFPNPIYQKWCYEYHDKVDSSVQINYSSIGSGGGQQQITAQTVDFGASDDPMSDAALAKAPGKILHIPTVAGAVVITYNLPDSPALKLDGPAIADIFLGNISSWNDPRIAALNPGVKLPAWTLPWCIARMGAARHSSSPTIFPASAKPGRPARKRANPSIGRRDPGAKGNEGVAGQVKQTPGAIGYIELAYARQNKLPFADIQNAAGEFVTPTIDSITKALATAQIPEDFRFSMVNPPGSGAYPICGATWLLVYETQKDPAKGKKLVEFLNWAMTQGEGMAASLDYAPLPDSVQQRVLERIKTIKY
jgi:phosphate transport system substrate-binding protein